MFCQTLHSTHTISICFGVGHGPSIKTLPKTNKTLKNNAWVRSHTFLLAQKLHLLGGSLAGFLLSGKCNSNFKNSPGFVRLHNVEDHFHNGQGQWWGCSRRSWYLWNACFPLKFRGCPVHQFTGGSQAWWNWRKPSKPIRFTMRSFWVQASKERR